MEKDSRERILDSAERLFARKGFSATSVREILKEAEVSSPMLYYYFGSKRDLLSTLARERFETFRQRALQEVGQAGTARETFTRFAGILFDGVTENPVSFRFMLSILQSAASHLSGEEFLRMKMTHRRFLWEQLERIRPDVDPDRRLFAVLCFHSLITGFIMLFLTGVQKRLDAGLAEAIGERAAAILDDEIPVPTLDFIWNPDDWREEP